jgi:5'-nucleotidase
MPACPAGQIKGIKYTHQGTEYLPDQFVSGTDPRGRNYYWMKSGLKKFRNKTLAKITNKTTSDIAAVKKKYISITPLLTNLTSWQVFDKH